MREENEMLVKMVETEREKRRYSKSTNNTPRKMESMESSKPMPHLNMVGKEIMDRD